VARTWPADHAQYQTLTRHWAWSPSKHALGQLLLQLPGQARFA
jgi:hypothetical protein